MVRAGSSKIRITPPLGTPLAGYPGRPAGANHVYDDLFIRTLALEDDGRPVIIMSSDLMGVEVEWVAELRHRTAEAHSLRAEQILFATTHTHSATGGLFSRTGRLGSAFAASFDEIVDSVDDVLYELLLRAAVNGVGVALAALRSATLSIGQGIAPGIARNRVDQSREVDESVLVVMASDQTGQPIGGFFHFACHPTVLGFKDVGISADFPGIACDIVERSLGHGAVVMHLNGALGDISTRFTRRSQSYPEVERFGRILGGSVLAIHGNAQPLPDVRLRSLLREVQVQPKSMKWIGQPEERVTALRGELERARRHASHGEVRQLETRLQGAESAVKLAQAVGQLTPFPVCVQRLQIARQLDLVAVPAEMFSGSARALQEQVPQHTVRLVGPANGYVGYIPERGAYDRVGYEVDSALVDQGAAETIVDCAVNLLQQT